MKQKPPRRVRCPKCGKLAEKRPYSKTQDMYVHSQTKREGYTVIGERCLVGVTK
jgi:hypothetical protein